MKKFFGILFLLIGVFGIGIGIVALTDLATRNRSFEGQIQNEFSETYNEKDNEQQAIGLVLIGCGLLFSILGAVMIASKSKKSKNKLTTVDNTQAANIAVPPIYNNLNTSKQSTKMDEVLNQIERLGKLKQQGLITEEEFQEQKKKCFA
ncbi:SHOCT domain-containing protein [Flavobacterium sandaracinum]|uniref:SHOCT domain-containing protein n=1 Tax=Flavobacterium sandaracinum TaxID=2541733 RepID=A0A4R5CYS8_9FLAO|nr:SHOCT domain-containing protein [Flavobacterium sandaracinum]TDE05816.1 SHOCT domain-containing protein [Flavobacterium sandaracinum]